MYLVLAEAFTSSFFEVKAFASLYTYGPLYQIGRFSMRRLEPYGRSDSSDAAPAATFQPLKEQSSYDSRPASCAFMMDDIKLI